LNITDFFPRKRKKKVSNYAILEVEMVDDGMGKSVDDDTITSYGDCLKKRSLLWWNTDVYSHKNTLFGTKGNFVNITSGLTVRS